MRAARSLLGLGVRPGDHVGILMPNCMDFLEVMFGAALIGAPMIPINARFKGRELSYVARDADLRLLVTSDIIDQHIDYVEILHGCLPGLSRGPGRVPRSTCGWIRCPSCAASCCSAAPRRRG